MRLSRRRHADTPVMTERKAGQRLRAARAARDAAGTQAARMEALHALSLAAFDSYAESSRLDLLDEAVAAAEECLRITPPAAAEDYSAYANDLGWLLRERYDARHEEGDLSRAVRALDTALRRTPTQHGEWPGRAMNLGNALTELHELTNMPEYLDKAIELLEEAVRYSPGYNRLLSSLARGLRIRYAERGSREDLARSAELDELALASTPPDDPDRGMMLGNAANGLSLTSTSRDARWQHAVRLWREAIELGLEQQPVASLTLCLNWLDRALARKAAPDATDAAVLAQHTLDRMVAAQASRSEQAVWLSNADRLPSLIAQVYLEAGDPERAVLALEHARAALFAAALLHGDGADRVTLGQLREIARRDGPLAYLVPCSRGMALIVDADGISVLPLPGLTQEAVAERVIALYESYLSRRAHAGGWRKALDQVTRWLWTAVMGPLLGSLGTHRQVNLLPSGLLALLPLHAAWEPARHTVTGRRYAGDQILITMQPNARLLLRPPPSAGAGRLVAVAEPKPTSQRPLRYAVAEAHAAAASFREPRIIAHEEATSEEVINAIARADVVHLACHSRMTVRDPLADGPVLAHDRVLTVSDILDSRLAARLVVALTCESAGMPPHLTEQVVNLAAALLHAGSHAVLAVAFAVDDFTALVLATRFYAEWTAGIPGPQALHAAVEFLRNTTNAEKLMWVGELRGAGWPAEVTGPLANGLRLNRQAERSFAHPVEWAPFMWWGRHVRG